MFNLMFLLNQLLRRYMRHQLFTPCIIIIIIIIIMFVVFVVVVVVIIIIFIIITIFSIFPVEGNTVSFHSLSSLSRLPRCFLLLLFRLTLTNLFSTTCLMLQSELEKECRGQVQNLRHLKHLLGARSTQLCYHFFFSFLFFSYLQK